MAKVIVSAAAGFLFGTGLLWLLWSWAPYPLIDGPTYESLLEKVLSVELEKFTSQQAVIYIHSDLKPVVTRLQSRFPKWQLLPMTQRPDQHGCYSNGPCGNPFISVDCTTFPL